MTTIHIDFDVFKALTAKRRDESHTENDVIRELLGLSDQDRLPDIENESAAKQAWVCKEVSFPEGTRFRSVYKGQEHQGAVKDGKLMVNGKYFQSPSAAATEVTGHSVNGWTFWECLLPGGDKWVVIANLRT